MDLLVNKMRIAIRSARVILWPAIALNTGIAAYSSGATLVQLSCISLSLCLIASYGFLVNDCKDIDVDRANRSNRLENANAAEVRFVWMGSVAMLLASLLTSSSLGFRGVITLAMIGLGLTFYTFVARRRLVLANVLAAVLASTPLWITSVILKVPLTISQLVVVLFTVALLVGREILLDVADLRGDSVGSRKTLATVLGRRLALNISVAIIGFGGIAMVVFLLWFKLTSHTFVAFAVAIVIMWLLLPPIFKFKEDTGSRPLRANFVSRSRAAMLLVPILWLSL